MRLPNSLVLALTPIIGVGCTYPLALEDPYYLSARRTFSASVLDTRRVLGTARVDAVLSAHCVVPAPHLSPPCVAAAQRVDPADLHAVGRWRRDEVRPLPDSSAISDLE